MQLTSSSESGREGSEMSLPLTEAGGRERGGRTSLPERSYSPLLQQRLGGSVGG